MLANYDLIAHIKGGEEYPDIKGTVGFKGVSGGTWVDVDVEGLPSFTAETEETAQIGPHGFHIHKNPCGEGDFSTAGEHFDKGNNPHGNHSGDLPALFSNGGVSKMLFFTDRFTPDEVKGKSVVIHLSPDDYKTQPSGGSGERIACGNIMEVKK